MKFFRIIKVTIAYVAILLLTLNCTVFAFGNLTPDTPSPWASDKLNTLRLFGILTKELDRDFRKPITREEFCYVSMELFKKNNEKIDNTSTIPFTDISNSIYKQNIIDAYSKGIVIGYGNEIFNPFGKITREEISAYLVRLTEAINGKKVVFDTEENHYKDMNLVSPWAIKTIDYCYKNEFIKGTAEQTLAPKEMTTREQAIVMLLNMFTRLTPKIFDTTKNSIDVQGVSQAVYEKNVNRIAGEENIAKLQKTFQDKTGAIPKALNEICNNKYLSAVQINEKELYIGLAKNETVDSLNVFILKGEYSHPPRRLITASTMYPSDTNFINAYKELLNISPYKEQILTIFEKEIALAISNGTVDTNSIQLSESARFSISSVPTTKGAKYYFEYSENISNIVVNLKGAD